MKDIIRSYIQNHAPLVRRFLIASVLLPGLVALPAMRDRKPATKPVHKIVKVKKVKKT